jgi:hypothetical protein
VDDSDFTQFIEEILHDLEDDSDRIRTSFWKVNMVWNYNEVLVIMKVILNWQLVVMIDFIT